MGNKVTKAVRAVRVEYDFEYSNIRANYRKGVSDALRDIREGEIDELTLDKLHNFCMTALMLMNKVTIGTWRSAEKAAELASLLQDIEQENNSTESNKENGNEIECRKGYAVVLEHTGTVESFPQGGSKDNSGASSQRT